MNQLYINAQGGMAGDMFAAALISAGADEALMKHAMWLAASKLGKAEIQTTQTTDGATRMQIHVHHNESHLGAKQALFLLNTIFEELELDEYYRLFGRLTLDILIQAELKAHSEHSFESDHLNLSHHSHDHDHDRSHNHHQNHDHQHDHSHHTHPHDHSHIEAWLHEAQDILIDVVGAAYGLQLLNAPTEATLLTPVSLGGGTITFSHGTMPVPAPATTNILQKYWIPAQLGPLETELCTPTGSAILAALKATQVSVLPNGSKLAEGTARGGKDLDIPPLKIILINI